MAAELYINDDHPLALELSSLRSAIARYQHESHTNSLKLQRHSLETTHALERAHTLERENAVLREEIALLRSHPEVSPHPAQLQVNELTLSLRRLSDKLTYTEELLVNRTTELANALSELSKAKHEVESAWEVASKARAREEEGKSRERELERKVRGAEEEKRLMDLVVKEYADLVRSLEGRSSSASPASPATPPPNGDRNGHAAVHPSSSNVTLVDGLSEGRTGLQKLLAEFNTETERLEAEIGRLHGEMRVLESKLDVERKGSESDRANFAQARVELEKMKVDDQAAAKVVSRYMKFSQSTTDSLQTALESLKARHGATLTTLNTQLELLQKTLTSRRKETQRLRDALDELTEDISRESYGRRREVTLRLKLLSREEGVGERLRRWVRKGEEALVKVAKAEDRPGEVLGTIGGLVKYAHEVLEALDGSNALEEKSAGTVARILAAQGAVDTLVKELQVETERRMRVERRLGRDRGDEKGKGPLGKAGAVLSLAPDGNGAAVPVAETRKEEGPDYQQAISFPAIGEKVDTSSNAELQTSAAVVDLSAEPPVKTPPSAENVTSGATPETSENTSVATPPPKPTQPGPIVVTSSSSIPESALKLVPQTPTHTKTGSVPISPITLVSVKGASEQPSSNKQISQLPSHDDVSNPMTPTPIASSDEHSAPSPHAEHPLLADLLKIKHRYDDLQRSFRECHLALKELKSTLSVSASGHSAPMQPILRTAIERLDDYNEDTHVELEIRVADEERVIRGYETFFSLPSTLSDASERAEMEADVRRFLDDSARSVGRVTDGLKKKLEDLQHDIAVVKRATHELEPEGSPPSPGGGSKQGGGWSLSGFLGAGSSPSPPPPPPPTFGSVMTTPRLRHSSSYSSLRSQRRSSSDSVHHSDPFASLGLRVPMPSHATVSSPSSSLNPNVGLNTPSARQRTLSKPSLFTLGFGASRTNSFTGPSNHGTPTKGPGEAIEEVDGTDEETTGDEEELDDVE